MQCPGISRHAFIFMAVGLSLFQHEQYVEYRDYNAVDMLALDRAASSFNYSQLFDTNDIDLQLENLMSNINTLHDLVPTIRKTLMIIHGLNHAKLGMLYLFGIYHTRHIRKIQILIIG